MLLLINVNTKQVILMLSVTTIDMDERMEEHYNDFTVSIICKMKKCVHCSVFYVVLC